MQGPIEANGGGGTWTAGGLAAEWLSQPFPLDAFGPEGDDQAVGLGWQLCQSGIAAYRASGSLLGYGVDLCVLRGEWIG